MGNGSAEQIACLETAVAVDAGAAGFPALAAAYRRAGRLDDAEDVLRAGLAREPGSIEARSVLALVLLDRGRGDDARQQLERLAEESLAAHALDRAPAIRELSQAELDAAFDAAETDAAELIDPNRVAEEAIEHADSGAVGLSQESPLTEGGTFATRTMAELLERQGDIDGAARIRASLDAAPSATPAGAAYAGGSDQPGGVIIAELERWLGNARRSRT